MDNETQQVLIRQTAENSAIRVCLAALFASHPNQEKLRQEIAQYSSLEMTTLATNTNLSEQFRDKIKKHFASYMSMIWKQAVADDRAPDQHP